ncbi:hypothetical protein NQ318_013635 [Aromia moschata]|uniref:Interference hedgehog n=1 Tax=Aromia moschata TaxID=1265417 RepID=A0AAV8XHW8_9CUCU|nr:hypothetical protein NQ318_013635 [Aromia moschata]
MEGAHIFCAISTILVVVFELALSDPDSMAVRPERISLSMGFETMLTCEMKIEPDRFQWKFYPTDDPYNPNVPIDLSNATFQFVPAERTPQQWQANHHWLRISIGSEVMVKPTTAGDYQCLAYYGAYVIALVPSRLTIATIKDFPSQKSDDLTVVAGNTVAWRCLPPESNPEALIDYYKNEQYVVPYPRTQSKSLILPNVSVESSGVFKCNATNNMETKSSPTRFDLKVVNRGPPKAPFFVIEPRRTYTAIKGDTVFLECAAVGNPVPKVFWFKKNGRLPSDRTEMLNGGLNILDVAASDEGVYVCNHTNQHGTVSHQIALVYNEEPSVDCLHNSTEVKQGDNLDLECVVTGVPRPRLAWFLNGFSVGNDSGVEAVGNRVYFRPVEKRHAGNLQLFASNRVRTTYDSVSVLVIPLSMSVDVSAAPAHKHHKHKGGAARKQPKHKTTMVPPSKPTISRLSDESVTVRWSVPDNDGLPIKFFKVQYREVGPANSNDPHRGKASRWKTTNADIAPNIQAFDITNLKPDHIYRFRIAAVYSNDDNKLSENSDKFHLRRLDFDNKIPLPIPRLVETETVNETAIKVYWEYAKTDHVSVDGFYISYMSASTAGDYIKATVDGEHVREYVITHLQPDTIYDIKLQSFNSKFASDFSPIMNASTWINQSSPENSTTQAPPGGEKAGFSNLYVTVAGVVIVCALLISAVVFLIMCRKWKKKKESTDRDKASVDSHIQAEGNECRVRAEVQTEGERLHPSLQQDNDHRQSLGRSGQQAISSSVVFQNQNVIEMPRLTAQNNNCSQESGSSGSTSRQESPADPKDKAKQKGKDKTKRVKSSAENVSSGENYV